MRYREVEIFAPKDMGPSGTEVIDIKVKDIISTIELIWQTTVATSAVMTAPHVDCISKVELIDGSDVLFSLSGKVAQALAFYGTGKMPLNQVSVNAGEKMVSVIPIYFGRYQRDKQLALDPTKFSNLQLRVTWDEDAANAGVTVNQLTVRGWVFDELLITPVGFLMSKEIKSYTPAANTYEYTDLPTDYPYRLIIMESYSTDKEPGEVLGQFKLSEDHDKRIPIDMTGDEILQKIVIPMGDIEEMVDAADATSASTIYVSPTANLFGFKDIDADVIAAGDDFSQVTRSGNRLTVDAAVNCLYYAFLVKGYAPHHCLVIPFGDLNDIDDWYDVTKLGSLRLITQGAAAVGTSPQAKVCLQQLRSY